MSEPFCCLSLNSAWGPWVSFPISGPVAVSALRKLVGVAGFEPATPTSRTSAATEKFNDFHEVRYVRGRSFTFGCGISVGKLSGDGSARSQHSPGSPDGGGRTRDRTSPA